MYSFTRDICWFCGINHEVINFPMFKGGPKKCECYEKCTRESNKMNYPTKEELNKKLVKQVIKELSNDNVETQENN